MLHILAHDAVTCLEVIVGKVHIVAQDTTLYAHGDLGGTGGLGTVADAAGDHGNGVLQRGGNALVACPAKPRDTAACAYAGADSAAVSAEAADARLLMDGNEVGEGDGAEDGLLVLTHQRTVAPHGDGGGNALIAGAGDDDHGHLAAVHAGIAACGGPSTSLSLGVIAALEKIGADVGAPGVLKPLLGDGGILLDLTRDQRFDLF